MNTRKKGIPRLVKKWFPWYKFINLVPAYNFEATSSDLDNDQEHV